MAIGKQIERRLEVLGWTQAELARVAKLPQSTVNSIVRKDPRMTPHLSKLAAALRVPADALTSDNATASPEAQALSPEQAEWLAAFEDVSDPDRATLLRVARAMRQDNGEPHRDELADADDGKREALEQPPAPNYREFTLPVLFPPEYALTRMFEALLAMVDPAAPTEEQALLLAKNLPVGLSQLRDLLPPVSLDREDASSVRPKTLAEPR